MTEDEKRYLLALKRRRATLLARDDLLQFARLMMPKQDAHEDPDQSEYEVAKHHRVIAHALQEVEKGNIKRLIINLGPRHGKSQLTSRLFPAWYMGRNPANSIIEATYNEKFSWDFGRDVRAIIQDPIYQQIFPEVSVLSGAASVDRLELEQKGKLFFVGRGGSLTGRGGHGLIIDDPIKDRVEADSPTTREKLWNWYNQVLKTRLLSSVGWIVVICTRWHGDDLVGRITDPMNASYSASEAKKWKIIDLPALAKDKDILGRKEGEALWPERFPSSYLYELREADPRGFQALYQGSPTPDSGNFFPAEKIRGYSKPTDRPPRDQLRFYVASDHAVSTKQERDKTCLLPIGIDADDNIWIMDDVEWGRWPSDVVVEKMLGLMQRYKPLAWWAERGHISKSIGPFLRKRQHEEGIYAMMEEIVPINDKMTRAQSIAARMAMGKVYIPTYAPWYMEAYNEMLQFPYGGHDDFCDAIALIGMGLAKQVRPTMARPTKKTPARGTFGWIKEQSRRAEMQRQVKNGGW
jgi:predicted phage terminase large subunit-like protein